VLRIANKFAKFHAKRLTHSLTAALDQLRVVASSTSNDPGPRSRQHQQIGQRLNRSENIPKSFRGWGYFFETPVAALAFQWLIQLLLLQDALDAGTVIDMGFA